LEDQKAENEALKPVRSSLPVVQTSTSVLETELEKVKKQNKTLENDKAKFEGQKANLLKAMQKMKELVEMRAREARGFKNELSLKLYYTKKELAEQKAENENLKYWDTQESTAFNKLWVTNGSLSIELDMAKANCNFVFEDEQKEQLEEQKAEIEALKARLKAKEAEIVKLKATNSSHSIDLDKAKTTCNLVFEDEQKEKEKAENEALKATISLLSIEKVTFKETTKVLEEQKAKNEALKTELKKARSKADQTSIKEACLKEKEAEIVHLKATNGSLLIDLDNAKNTCDIVFEDEKKECKCSVTKILNSDLQKKVNRMKELLDLREKEIRLLNDELKNSE
jgi:hypothetical protein